MKVTHITTGLELGGAERSLSRLVVSTSSQVEQSVVSLTDEGHFGKVLVDAGIPVTSLGMTRSPTNWVAALSLVRHVWHRQSHLLVGWMYGGSLAAAIGALSSATPFVANLRYTPRSLRSEPIVRGAELVLCSTLSRFASALVFNSGASQERHRRLGFPEAKGVVIPNAVPRFPPFERQAIARHLRRELLLPEETPLVGRIARWDPMKDYPAFFEACATIRKRFPDAWFVVAGPGINWRNHELQRLVKARKLEDRTVLLGKWTPIHTLLGGLDIVCSTSLFGESFPNILSEAVVCGALCVGTDVGATREILDGRGLIVPPGEPESLADAVSRLLSLSASDRHSRARSARENLLNAFPQEEASNGEHVEVWRRAAGR